MKKKIDVKSFKIQWKKFDIQNLKKRKRRKSFFFTNHFFDDFKKNSTRQKIKKWIKWKIWIKTQLTFNDVDANRRQKQQQQ